MSRAGWRAWAILGAAVASGALRDFLFVNINYQVDHVRRATAFSYAHSAFQKATAGWDTGALNALKWGLSLAFMVCMWAACLGLSRAFRRLELLWGPITSGFTGAALLSVLLHFLARYVPGAEEASVNLAHAIQYPLVPAMLFAGLWFAERVGK